MPSSLVLSALSPRASEVDFGVRITGIDLANLRDEDFAVLSTAVYTHLVVVIPNQGHLKPSEQLHLNKLFDPGAEEYGHGSNLALTKASVLQNDLLSLPSAPQVKLLGNGFVAEHDSGLLRGVNLRHPMHSTFHKDPLPDDDSENTRYFRWHIDAALYFFQPPRVTTLLCLQVPEGKPQVVRYDDGTGDTLQVPLATTAFVSGEYAFKTLNPEAKAFALQTMVRYHAHPYIWMRKQRPCRLGWGSSPRARRCPTLSYQTGARTTSAFCLRCGRTP